MAHFLSFLPAQTYELQESLCVQGQISTPTNVILCKKLLEGVASFKTVDRDYLKED
jgi:hypothetical protein